MSSAATDPSSESSPAKRSLVIESSSIEPIIRQLPYHKSEIQQITFYHQWSIENFSFYCINENSGNKYPYLLSSQFSSPSNDKLPFRLQLFPNGDREDGKDYISLFLHHENCDRNEIVLKCKFWILGSDGVSSKTCESKMKFDSKNRNWGCIKYCAHEYILEHKLTPGDVLTICFRISYEETVDAVSYDLNEIALTQLKNDCSQLSMSNGEIVLEFGDGEDKEEFAVHKAILGARSCVFAAMFEHDMKEKNKRRVEITDVEAEVGREFLKYLYGNNPCLEMYADGLLPMADKYQLDSLKSMCEDALCFRINPESVGNLLLLADMHNSTVLKSKCIDYIHCHSSCVVECESIQGLSGLMQSRPELYYELFKQIPQDSCNTWSPPTLTCDPYKSSWSYTSSSVSKCSKLLTIHQFNENHLSVAQSYLDKNPHDIIEISSFPQSSDNSPVQFSVKLYPHGENDECKEDLSLQLQLKCDDKMKVAVKVKASIMVRQNSAKGYTQEIGKKMYNGESIGWSKFITREQLMQNKDLLLNSNGQLVLLFEVFYISNIDNPVTKSGLNTFADEHKFSIARDLSQFYPSQKLTDIVFVFGQKMLHAHKSIVSARSSAFARMFKRKSRVQIKNVDVVAFSHVLALLYGQTEPLTHSAHKMLPLVDKYKLDSLRQVCEIALCSQLSDTNIAQFLLLAEKHKASMLKAKAFEYIRRKHSMLTQNDSLKVIQQQNPKLFNELLCYKLDNWRNLTDK